MPYAPTLIDKLIADVERGLRDPRVRGAFRDRQVMNTGTAWTDAKVRSFLRDQLRRLRAARVVPTA